MPVGGVAHHIDDWVDYGSHPAQDVGWYMRLNSVLCINFVSSDGDVDSYIFIPLSIEIDLQNNETRQGEDNIVDKNYTNLIDMTI